MPYSYNSPSWPQGVPKVIVRMILKEHFAGESVTPLAKKYSVSTSFINKLCAGILRYDDIKDLLKDRDKKCPDIQLAKKKNLTHAQIRSIRKSNISCRQLAKQYNTSKTTISLIKQRKIYKNVKDS